MIILIAKLENVLSPCSLEPLIPVTTTAGTTAGPLALELRPHPLQPISEDLWFRVLIGY